MRCYQLLPPFVFDTRLDPNRFSTNLMRATVLSLLTEKINVASLVPEAASSFPSLSYFIPLSVLSLSLPSVVSCSLSLPRM
jgi:hypothetical protein